MDIVTSNYLPGDPRLIDQIVYELKSQGIFDQFRKECIADVDTKPAYQNLSQRVEGSVMNFLKKQRFSEDMNKNQLREQLRKNIFESGFLETGVERIVDQVVNPKINTVFLPKVQDVVYRYLGIEKPNQEAKQEEKLDVVDLLPNDLEAISPESVNDHSFNSSSDKKDESIETNENSLNSSNTKTEDESPPFELLEENTKFSVHEENSVDSNLSGISGLASHESNHSTEMKDDHPMDISQDVSQNSLNSEANLSIVTSDEDVKMEICEDSNLLENKEVKELICGNNDNDKLLEIEIKEEKENILDETDTKEKKSEKIEQELEDIQVVNEIKLEDKKEFEVTKSEDKKTHESRNDLKKNHDKHKSSRGDKDRKDNKDKKSRSKSESKSKDCKDSKSHSKHSSSSKDKERDKDKKDYRNGKDKEEGSEKDKQVKKEEKEREKSKDKSNKNKEKLEKDRNKHEKDKVAKDKERSDKEKTYKEKSDKDKSDKDKSDKSRSEKVKTKSDRDKDKLEKDKLDKDKTDKDRSDKEKINKDKLEKDKPEKEKNNSSKHSKDKSLNSSKREGSTKEKDTSEDKLRDKSSSSKDKGASSSSKHKESSNKDKDKSSKDKDSSKKPSLSSSSSKGKEKDKERKGSGDSKSKSSDKHKKLDKDKSLHHNKTNSPPKKDKDKKAIDDHYSLKDKKSERRSTDRDSNDGSSKMSRNGSFTDSFSQSFKGSSKESSEVFSSGSGDSSNSDKMEDTVDKAMEIDNVNVVKDTAPQAIKYIKPKFASNIHEAMKIMKIRKQLAKMERQNQLSLAQVHPIRESQSEPKFQLVMKELSVVLEKSSLKPTKAIISKNDSENGAIKKVNNTVELVTKDESVTKEQVTEEPPILKSLDLSMESFEALEARLAQEMSNVNYHMYGEEDDSYEYSTVSFSPVKKRKASDEVKYPCVKKISFNTSSANVDNDEVEWVVREKVEELTNEVRATKNIPVVISDLDDANNKEIVDRQVPGIAKEINFIENGPVSDSVTNGNLKELELVVDYQTDPIQEIITIQSDEKVPTSSVFKKNINDIEIGQGKMPTLPDFITNVDKKENQLVIEIEPLTEHVKQVNESAGEISTKKSDEKEEIVISDSLQLICDFTEEVDVSSEATEIINHEDGNIFVENRELVLDDVQEVYIKDSDHVGDDNCMNVENKKVLVEHIEEIILEDIYETDDVEMDALQLDSDHNEDLEEKYVDSKLKNGDEFRGFDDVDRNNANVIKFTWKISEMERNILEKQNNDDNAPIASYNIPELASIKTDKPNISRKEEGIILKHGLSLEATIKEVTNMSSTIQDLLQKNGKKLFIKIDKLENKLPSKVLVSLQGMETNKIVASPVCEVNDVSLGGEINRQQLKDGKESLECNNGEETNRNGQIFKKPLNVNKDVLPSKSKDNELKEKKDCNQDGEWEDDNNPCYYFVNSDFKSEKHLKILNYMIGKLEKAVEEQSLQIQNNIPAVKTRGRKRKALSTENNNSISAECKPEPKRKHLNDAASHRNGENLCNANVSQNQSFSLPLSPADSEKSDEHKKEEPLTVKTKRTGRVSNTKRYSSEDLYKPRPVLKYGSSRRRSAKQDKS